MRKRSLWFAAAVLAAPLATNALAQQPAPYAPAAQPAPIAPPTGAMAPMPPAGQVLIAADSIVGAKIRDVNGEEIGQVKQLMLAPEGRIQYAVLALGGVLGVGGEEVAVPWQSLQVKRDKTAVIVTADRQVLTQAPKYDAASDAGADTDNDGVKDRDQ
jgi:sporulation protein YlmC with PRC-barrel domain